MYITLPRYFVGKRDIKYIVIVATYNSTGSLFQVFLSSPLYHLGIPEWVHLNKNNS